MKQLEEIRAVAGDLIRGHKMEDIVNLPALAWEATAILIACVKAILAGAIPRDLEEMALRYLTASSLIPRIPAATKQAVSGMLTKKQLAM